jgi:hypothetical protein
MLQDQHLSAEQPVDSQAAAIQTNESPEATLDRTRHLLARSRMTLDAANKRLSQREDGQEPPPRRATDPRS